MRTRTGRRPGESRTRQAIADAARRMFGESGYDRVSLRAIAAEAGVDPSLVLHYFGTKERLFLSVVGLPFRPADMIDELLVGERAEIGLRLARFALARLEDPATRSGILAVVRAASSEPSAAAVLRDLLSSEVFEPLAEALGVEDGRLRANLVGTQVVGLAIARYVVAVEPLASLPADEVAAAIAPNIQRYLAEPLD